MEPQFHRRNKLNTHTSCACIWLVAARDRHNNTRSISVVPQELIEKGANGATGANGANGANAANAANAATGAKGAKGANGARKAKPDTRAPTRKIAAGTNI